MKTSMELDEQQLKCMTECDNCGYRCRASKLKDVDDLDERLDPGGTVPAGQCPKCGCLSYFREKTRKVATPTTVAEVFIIVCYADESGFNGDVINNIEGVYLDKSKADADCDRLNHEKTDIVSDHGEPVYYVVETHKLEDVT